MAHHASIPLVYSTQESCVIGILADSAWTGIKLLALVLTTQNKHEKIHQKHKKINRSTNELNTGKKFNVQNALAHKIPYSKRNQQILRNSPVGEVPKVRLLLYSVAHNNPRFL